MKNEETQMKLETQREARQRRAIERQAERATRSDREQLELLMHRGHGNCKEAKRLERNLDNG